MKGPYSDNPWVMDALRQHVHYLERPKFDAYQGPATSYHHDFAYLYRINGQRIEVRGRATCDCFVGFHITLEESEVLEPFCDIRGGEGPFAYGDFESLAASIKFRLRVGT